MAKQLKLSWYSDLKAESDLRRMAVTYSVVSIPFAKIDIKESQVNGARLKDAIRHHKVEDYMQGFKNCDTFPRPVVHKTATGYVILSGNQRCEAIRRLIAGGELPKDLEIEAYLVDTTDRLLLEIIARAANAAHGEGDTKEERIMQAVYCVQRLGLSTPDAAKSFLICQSSIRDRIKAEEVRSQLQLSGVAADSISLSALTPMAKLGFDNSTQVKLGTLVAQHAPPAERVKQVVDSLSKKSTAQARFAVVKEFEKELAAAVHASHGSAKHLNGSSKVPSRPRREKFLRDLQRLVNFLESGNAGEPFANLEQLQVTNKTDRDLCLDLSKRLKYRLGVVVK